VKVTVKVIWKRICIQQTESWFFLEWEQQCQGRNKERDISCSSLRKWEQKTQNGGLHPLVLCWRVGVIHVVQDNGSGWLRWLLKKVGVILAPGMISWISVIVLLRETLSNLLVPALIDREFLFEILNLCFA
jgi:hypothetical protein